MYSPVKPNKDDNASRDKDYNEAGTSKDEKSRSSRTSTERRHHDSKDRSHRHSSSERRKSDSRREHSRSQDRSHRREKHSSHRSRRHRHRSQSPAHRSRSPRDKSRRRSPPFNKAMHAQERLARRLERAKDNIKRKEGSKKESDGGKVDGVKRATDVVSQLANSEAISSRATAQIEALRAKAFAETGVEVPSYYNPLAVNPMVYAQQMAKRKKLWAKKEDTEVEKEKPDQSSAAKSALWSGVKFGDDKSDEKFAKLMGIKSKGQTSKESQDIVKKQAEVFQKLDLQYQQARLATHTQRGVGLGFSSTIIDPNVPVQSNNGAQSSLR